MSKYLIINADDFGYNSAENTAIVELIRSGLITSTSVMTIAPEAEKATALSKAESFPVGVHLTINSDSDALWNPISDAKSFRGGLPHDGRHLTFKTTRADVRKELKAQYDFLIERGADVDHADNHCATLYGINGRRFYIDAFDFCKERDLPYRFPKTPGFLERQLGRQAPGIVKKFQSAIVACGNRRGVKMLDDLVSNPWSIKKIPDRNTLEEYYLNAIDNCIDGVTEMFLHPALPFENASPEWQKRVYEYEILKSGVLQERAREKDVQLVSWKIFKENNL